VRPEINCRGNHKSVCLQHGFGRQVTRHLSVPVHCVCARIVHKWTLRITCQQSCTQSYCVLCVVLQVRGFPCDCQYSKYCDSQLGVLPPPRSAQLQQQDAHQSEQQQQPVQHHTHSQQHSIHAGQAGEQQQLQQSPAGGVDGKLPANGEAAADEVEGPSSSGRVAAEALEHAHVHQVSKECCQMSASTIASSACLLLLLSTIPTVCKRTTLQQDKRGFVP
jgi:hypothetical protein